MANVAERLRGQQDDLPTNADIERGVRDAYIQATLMVLDAYAEGGGPGGAGGHAPTPNGKQWAGEVKKAYLKELAALRDATHELVHTAPDLEAHLASLLSPRGVDATERARELQQMLQDGLIAELGDRFGGSLPAGEVPAGLVTLIRVGWDVPPRDGKVGEQTGHLDWFTAFRAFFAETYKTNERLRSIVDGKLLAGLSVAADGKTLLADELKTFLGGFAGLVETVDKVHVLVGGLPTIGRQVEVIHHWVLKQPATRATGAAGTAGPPFQVPFRTDTFTGRGDDLEAIAAGLTGRNAVVISGIGG